MKNMRRIICLMICATFILGACNDSSQTSSHSSDDTSSKTVSKSEESSNTTSESSKPTEPTDPMKDFKPVFRAVVCSDVHVSSYGSTEAKRFAQLFKSTYKYAENNEFYKKLDAVAVAGDFTNNGNANEYEAFNRVANENIKDETKLITVMGNHEYYGGGQPVYLANMDTVLDKDINVNGYHFIGLSPFNGNDYNDDQIKWLKEKLAAADAEDTNKPIFTFQHHHIQNTVYVAKTWYTGSSAKLNAAYKKYPQVLNFSGHSHGPINNPLSLFQKDYTLLGTGTLSYFEMETGMTGGTIPPNSNIAAQYYIIEVDAKNHVRILPYDLMTDTFFKTAASTDGDKQLIYSIDNLKDPSSFLYNNATRKTNATAPVFAEGITVDVSDVKINGAKISFKQADDDSCVYNYDVVCTPKNGGNKITQKFFSEYYFEPMPETVEYTISGLEPSTEYNIEVFAVNVWDKKSKPLTASITTKADVPVIYESINNVKYFGTFTNFDSIDKMLRSSSSFAYGGKVEGDYFAGDYASNTSYAVSDAAIAAGKGYEGSKAVGVWTGERKNQGLYLYANETNKNTSMFPRFKYIRLWVDFTDIDFRKACMGLVSPTGGLFTTDDCDGRNDLEFYYLADGKTEWKTLMHGGDGCFGSAQSSSVKDFKGWMAFPVKDMIYRSGTGSAPESAGVVYPYNEVSAFFMYWDYSDVSMQNKKFYLDEIQYVADYKDFTEYKK